MTFLKKNAKNHPREMNAAYKFTILFFGNFFRNAFYAYITRKFNARFVEEILQYLKLSARNRKQLYIHATRMHKLD